MVLKESFLLKKILRGAMSIYFENFFNADLPESSKKYSGFPKYNFIGGHNSKENIPVNELIESISNGLIQEGNNLALYGHNNGPQGNLNLRNFLCTYLKDFVGMSINKDNILITSGSLQALDLVNSIFLEAGDTVLVEEATYGGALTRLKSRGVKYKGVKLTSDGICPDNLEETVIELNKKNIFPKFLYTIPTVQNPTGTIMSEKTRNEILRIAKKYNFLIFEDDCYADLIWDRKRPRAFYSLCTDSRVIYCGSFSKSIAPSLRVGYIVANWDVISKILSIKNDGGSGAIEQIMLANFCNNHFEIHAKKLVKDLKSKCDTMIAALDKEFGSIAEFYVPKGGIFLWVTLPRSVDTNKLSILSSENGVAINPGSEWVSDPERGNHKLRLCFANPENNLISEGIKKLSSICYEEFGVPKVSDNTKRS